MASASEGGAISPSGSVVVANGGTTNFQISADTYYYINEVLTNGAVVAQSFGPGVAEGSVVWSNIVEDGTIHASFGENLAQHQSRLVGLTHLVKPPRHSSYERLHRHRPDSARAYYFIGVQP